ncbi:MAG TPA: rubrerythrin family protein [Elusimicrobiales bacterium]|nr:rubrerythrin family protein [Elusimicrobiales bacterium]
MSKLKGTQTEKNLLTAFAGESQARNRYTYFASKAKNEGYMQISKIFEETAEQEKEHAKRFFKFLKGGPLTITGEFPAGVIASTEDNLRAAMEGEDHEWGEMYPNFATTATKEGLEEVAKVFESVSVAEKQHAKRYKGLLENIKNGTVFVKSKPIVWRCLNCGYTHKGEKAPEQCRACAHPKAYFEILSENW